jgi:hypothetical protein
MMVKMPEPPLRMHSRPQAGWAPQQCFKKKGSRTNAPSRRIQIIQYWKCPRNRQAYHRKRWHHRIRFYENPDGPREANQTQRWKWWAAFERILTAPGNGELRQAYQVTKGMASLEPTSVGVGSSETSDDSAEAVRLLAEMAEKQGRQFEEVFSDPANAKLVARTYTAHHRSSVNTDYLEQEWN